MQENGDFFAIFSLEDARVASYSLRAPHNAKRYRGPRWIINIAEDKDGTSVIAA